MRRRLKSFLLTRQSSQPTSEQVVQLAHSRFRALIDEHSAYLLPTLLLDKAEIADSDSRCPSVKGTQEVWMSHGAQISGLLWAINDLIKSKGSSEWVQMLKWSVLRKAQSLSELNDLQLAREVLLRASPSILPLHRNLSLIDNAMELPFITTPGSHVVWRKANLIQVLDACCCKVVIHPGSGGRPSPFAFASLTLTHWRASNWESVVAFLDGETTIEEMFADLDVNLPLSRPTSNLSINSRCAAWCAQAFQAGGPFACQLTPGEWRKGPEATVLKLSRFVQSMQQGEECWCIHHDTSEYLIWRIHLKSFGHVQVSNLDPAFSELRLGRDRTNAFGSWSSKPPLYVARFALTRNDPFLLPPDAVISVSTEVHRGWPSQATSPKSHDSLTLPVSQLPVHFQWAVRHIPPDTPASLWVYDPSRMASLYDKNKPLANYTLYTRLTFSVSLSSVTLISDHLAHKFIVSALQTAIAEFYCVAAVVGNLVSNSPEQAAYFVDPSVKAFDPKATKAEQFSALKRGFKFGNLQVALSMLSLPPEISPVNHVLNIVANARVIPSMLMTIRGFFVQESYMGKQPLFIMSPVVGSDSRSLRFDLKAFHSVRTDSLAGISAFLKEQRLLRELLPPSSSTDEKASIRVTLCPADHTVAEAWRNKLSPTLQMVHQLVWRTTEVEEALNIVQSTLSDSLEPSLSKGPALCVCVVRGGEVETRLLDIPSKKSGGKPIPFTNGIVHAVGSAFKRNGVKAVYVSRRYTFAHSILDRGCVVVPIALDTDEPKGSVSQEVMDKAMKTVDQKLGFWIRQDFRQLIFDEFAPFTKCKNTNAETTLTFGFVLIDLGLSSRTPSSSNCYANLIGSPTWFYEAASVMGKDTKKWHPDSDEIEDLLVLMAAAIVLHTDDRPMKFPGDEDEPFSESFDGENLAVQIVPTKERTTKWEHTLRIKELTNISCLLAAKIFRLLFNSDSSYFTSHLMRLRPIGENFISAILMYIIQVLDREISLGGASSFRSAAALAEHKIDSRRLEVVSTIVSCATGHPKRLFYQFCWLSGLSQPEGQEMVVSVVPLFPPLDQSEMFGKMAVDSIRWARELLKINAPAARTLTAISESGQIPAKEAFENGLPAVTGAVLDKIVMNFAVIGLAQTTLSLLRRARQIAVSSPDEARILTLETINVASPSNPVINWLTDIVDKVGGNSSLAILLSHLASGLIAVLKSDIGGVVANFEIALAVLIDMSFERTTLRTRCPLNIWAPSLLLGTYCATVLNYVATYLEDEELTVLYSSIARYVRVMLEGLPDTFETLPIGPPELSPSPNGRLGAVNKTQDPQIIRKFEYLTNKSIPNGLFSDQTDMTGLAEILLHNMHVVCPRATDAFEYAVKQLVSKPLPMFENLMVDRYDARRTLRVFFGIIAKRTPVWVVGANGSAAVLGLGPPRALRHDEALASLDAAMQAENDAMKAKGKDAWMLTVPVPNPYLTETAEAPVGLASGEHHSVILCKSGRLIVMGSNREGQLGFDMKRLRTLWTGAAGRLLFKRLTTDCFYDYERGCVETEEYSGESFHLPWSVTRPLTLALSRNGQPLPLRRIVAGSDFTLAITDTAELVSFGNPNSGCLGRGKHCSSSPGLVPLPAKVRQVSAGVLHVSAVVEPGRLFVWGCGDAAQLGVGRAAETVYAPREIALYMWRIYNRSSDLSDVFSSWMSLLSTLKSAAKTASGGRRSLRKSLSQGSLLQTSVSTTLWSSHLKELFELGAVTLNLKYQVFLLHCPSSMGLRQILDQAPGLSPGHFQQVSCGEAHTLAKVAFDQTSYVVGWGQNEFGQLGMASNNQIKLSYDLVSKKEADFVEYIEQNKNGSNSFRTYPDIVELPLAVEIDSIEAGGTSSCACSRGGNTLFVWGCNDDNCLGVDNSRDSIDTPLAVFGGTAVSQVVLSKSAATLLIRSGDGGAAFLGRTLLGGGSGIPRVFEFGCLKNWAALHRLNTATTSSPKLVLRSGGHLGTKLTLPLAAHDLSLGLNHGLILTNPQLAAPPTPGQPPRHTVLASPLKQQTCTSPKKEDRRLVIEKLIDDGPPSLMTPAAWPSARSSPRKPVVAESSVPSTASSSFGNPARYAQASRLLAQVGRSGLDGLVQLGELVVKDVVERGFEQVDHWMEQHATASPPKSRGMRSLTGSPPVSRRSPIGSSPGSTSRSFTQPFVRVPLRPPLLSSYPSIEGRPLPPNVGPRLRHMHNGHQYSCESFSTPSRPLLKIHNSTPPPPPLSMPSIPRPFFHVETRTQQHGLS